jgi:hypothetical protein
MGEQRLLHVALAEGDARLPQVARDRTQDRDVAPVEARAKDERVEAVALDVAPPDAGDASWKRSRTSSTASSPSPAYSTPKS